MTLARNTLIKRVHIRGIQPMLDGKTILIVEPEFLIALDIQRCLETLGAVQTVFARNTDEVFAAASHWSSFAVALVDSHLVRDDKLALLGGLRQAGVKLVLMTSDNATQHSVPSFKGTPAVMKPFSEHDLASAISQALAG